MGTRLNETLSTPLELPCGAVLKNRIVKSAMSDSLGDGRGNPTSEQIQLYQRWAQGGLAAWYTMRLTNLGEGNETVETPDLEESLRRYDERDINRISTWKHRFANGKGIDH